MFLSSYKLLLICLDCNYSTLSMVFFSNSIWKEFNKKVDSTYSCTIQLYSYVQVFLFETIIGKVSLLYLFVQVFKIWINHRKSIFIILERSVFFCFFYFESIIGTVSIVTLATLSVHRLMTVQSIRGSKIHTFWKSFWYFVWRFFLSNHY